MSVPEERAALSPSPPGEHEPAAALLRGAILGGRPFRVGDWQVDPAARRMSRGERELLIEPKILGVLQSLAARAGDVVTRQQLLDEVWPGVFVTEDPLNRAISELRKIFGDEARNSRAIETIPKRGYRLLERVELGSANERRGPHQEPGHDALAARVPGVPARRGARRGALALAATAALIVAAALIAAWVGSAPSPAPRLEIGRVVPVTSFEGVERLPALAPDGRRVAFSMRSEANGEFDLYVAQVGDPALLRLTSAAGDDAGAAWSPDGASVAFQRLLPGRREIWIVSALGGGERRVYTSSHRHAAGLDWSPDGADLAVADRLEASDAPSIVVASIATGERRRLTSPPVGASDALPAFSPDGRWVAFRRERHEGAYDLFVVGREGGEARAVSADATDLGGFDWLADSSGLVAASNRSGAFELWRFPIGGGEPERLGIESVFLPSIAGGRLVGERRRSDTAIWRLPHPHSGDPERSAERWIDSTLYDLDPAVAPTSGRVAFVSMRSGSYELWRANRDGAELVQVTRIGGTASAWQPTLRTPRWAPDERTIALSAKLDGRYRIVLVDAESGSLRRLPNSDAAQGQPVFTSDGRRLYFVETSGVEAALVEHDLVNGRPSGRRWPLEPGALVTLAPDGTLVVGGGGRSGLRRFDPERGSATPLGAEEIVARELGASSASLLVFDREGILHGLDLARPERSWNRPLRPLEPAGGELVAAGGIAVSADQRWILFTRTEAHESDLVLVELDGASARAR